MFRSIFLWRYNNETDRCGRHDNLLKFLSWSRSTCLKWHGIHKGLLKIIRWWIKLKKKSSKLNKDFHSVTFKRNSKENSRQTKEESHVIPTASLPFRKNQIDKMTSKKIPPQTVCKPLTSYKNKLEYCVSPKNFSQKNAIPID